jgi:cytochrome P450/nitrite reductase/ring-hydroxylating ferredoxin subunit
VAPTGEPRLDSALFDMAVRPLASTDQNSDDQGKGWSRVARAGEILADRPYAVSSGTTDLVLLRSRSGLRAYEARCPHQGALLGEGEIEGDALVCRNHRWRFDAETGRRIGAGGECLRACPVRESDGSVLVDVSGLSARTGSGRVATRRFEDLPGPRPLPVIGNAFQASRATMHLAFEDWARTYGPMYALRIGPRKILVITDPELVEPLYRARPDTYRRPSQIEDIFTELRVAGVFSAEGETWRAQRRLAMEALSQRHLRGFYPSLARIGARLLRRWGEAPDTGRVLEITDELKRFTVDVTTLLVFGHDLQTLEKGDADVIQRHLEHLFPAFSRRLTSLVPYWRLFRLPADRRVDRAVASIYTWLQGVLREARAAIAADPARAEAPANFIEAMLTARAPDGKPFSDDVILGNGLTMLLAGEDTTAYTLSWCMHHLCDFPEGVEALRREADATFGGAELPQNLEQAQSLAYAAAVANETMRIRPVVPLPIFEPTVDVVVGDVAAPKGTNIVYVARSATGSPAHFDAPDEFRPERWLDGGGDGKAHDASTHLPFGSGPRICPGRSLALLEMRVVLASVYSAFDVERVGQRHDVKEALSFTMTPVGIRLRLKRRRA